MNNFKAAVVAAAGVAVGVLMLRTIRQRRKEPRDEAKSSVEAAIEEGIEALDHAVAAVGHARDASEKGAEYARTELGTEEDPVTVESDSPLRRVGKDLMDRKP